MSSSSSVPFHAGMPDGEYAFGPRHGMRAVVSNGEARIPDGTALASSVFPMNEMVRVFRDLVGCPLWQAVRMASLTPAQIVRADDAVDAGVGFGHPGDGVHGRLVVRVGADEDLEIRVVGGAQGVAQHGGDDGVLVPRRS